MADLVYTGVLYGLVLGFVSLGLMISFKILNLPDLSAEGAYPLGGALCSVFLLCNMSPLWAILGASILTASVGLLTAFVHLRFHIHSLLASIIITTMIYSANLRIMGKPNISLFDHPSLFGQEHTLLSLSKIVGILIVLIVPFYFFLKTLTGLRFRALGMNKKFILRQAVDANYYIASGLAISSFFYGMAGSIVVQLQSYADIHMGFGIVIHALAALIIGESICGTENVRAQCLAPLVGALVYQQIQGIAMMIGFTPSDLKLVSGLIILFIIAWRKKNIVNFE